MLIYKKNLEYQELQNEVTPTWAYLSRRDLMKGAAVGLVSYWTHWAFAQGKFNFKTNADFSKLESPYKKTEKNIAVNYNNFYEFSLEKEAVAKKVGSWKIDSWKLEVGGLVRKPRTLNLADLTTAFELEERLYRFRCVEAWSMVIPWIGFPLSKLIENVEPKPEAQYVQFTTMADKATMPGVRELNNYPWPYTEGLTLAEAKNPLTMIVVGHYGETLAKQSGAPVRLIVPWKYGFKSAKSLVKIEFVKERPIGLWEKLAPSEYGFYANVNPKVEHPRWTQASEKVIDGSFFPKRIPTQMFNGYEKQVASLYTGLDLAKNY